MREGIRNRYCGPGVWRRMVADSVLAHVTISVTSKTILWFDEGARRAREEALDLVEETP